VLEQLQEITAAASATHLVIVSNEVGYGIVPTTKVGRMFRDLQGLANQRVAAAADRVIMTVAGIPIQIKPSNGIPIFGEETK
jgi:adenosylcobinamide kinase/adenosylcobinamide-phosphate guanylyltransferase